MELAQTFGRRPGANAGVAFWKRDFSASPASMASIRTDRRKLSGGGESFHFGSSCTYFHRRRHANFHCGNSILSTCLLAKGCDAKICDGVNAAVIACVIVS